MPAPGQDALGKRQSPRYYPAVVSTQDVSFGAMWMRLVGGEARWDSGDNRVDALAIAANDPMLQFGPGLVAVWVNGDGPVLVCDPHKALRAIKTFKAGSSVEELRAALRAGGAVKHEDPRGRRDTP